MKEGINIFANLEDIKRRVPTIRSEIRRMEEDDKKAPGGELVCARNGKNYKWYLKGARGYEYLCKNKRDLAQKLAVKKYHNMRKKDLYAELDACEEYLRRSEYKGRNADKLLEHDEYMRLLGGNAISTKTELEIWKNAEYERNTNYPEKLNVKGTQGKLLRSKSEAIIDRILYNAGIPFHYEEKLVLKNTFFYPDFTIRHPRTGAVYYWEHFGMRDNQDYINNSCIKLRTYCENGIVPSVNLILTYETMEHPLGIDDVEWLVSRYFM